MTPAQMKKEIMAIVGTEAFNAIGKMTDKQFRQWEDTQALLVEPVSYEKKYCEKEKTVRTHALDTRTDEVICLNCGRLK